MSLKMKNEDLRQALDKDNRSLREQQKIQLNPKDRTRILFQVASGIHFLHEEVKGERLLVNDTFDYKNQHHISNSKNNNAAL